MVLVQLQELLEVEARHRDDRGARAEAEVHEHLHAVDVEERQDGDEASSSSIADRPSVCTMFATRLRWVSMTPFDRPVVPDE